MSVHVFLGPTLSRAEAKQYLDATYHPPVQQGDVLRVMRQEPSTILIVDGFFQFVPSVWHKELLTALSCGIQVFGASSIGALRAAELADFGMVGVGRVFHLFKTGALEDDDEVAVAHANAEQGFRALSEALVNIRHICQSAAVRSVIPHETADAIVNVAKRIHYSARHWALIEEEAERLGVATPAIESLRRFRLSRRYNLKQRDALGALRLLARRESVRRRVARFRVESTVFFVALQREIQSEATPDLEQSPGTVADIARKKVLLGILASREAQRSGHVITADAVENITAWFREAYSVPSGAAFDIWLAARGLSHAAFDQAMRRFVAIVQTQEQLTEQVERELAAYWHLHSAAASTSHDSPQWTQVNVHLCRRNGNATDSAQKLFRIVRRFLIARRHRLGIESFHFTRKPPDVRLRILCARPAGGFVSEIQHLLRDRNSGTESVFVSVYEPEARLFGGILSMQAVHSFFEADSINAMRWLDIPRVRRRTANHEFSFRVIDDLFERALEGGSEVWDAWNNIMELTTTHGARQQWGLDTFPSTFSKEERSIWRSYQSANQRLADRCRDLWHRGALTVGLRALISYVAMFHFNRYGLDGMQQAEIARFAIQLRNPGSFVSMRGRADG
jgi:thiopeptide-type bacteriocin biosynthesis protein